jgi:hypothetical protein
MALIEERSATQTGGIEEERKQEGERTENRGEVPNYGSND